MRSSSIIKISQSLLFSQSLKNQSAFSVSSRNASHASSFSKSDLSSLHEKNIKAVAISKVPAEKRAHKFGNMYTMLAHPDASQQLKEKLATELGIASYLQPLLTGLRSDIERNFFLEKASNIAKLNEELGAPSFTKKETNVDETAEYSHGFGASSVSMNEFYKQYQAREQQRKNRKWGSGPRFQSSIVIDALDTLAKWGEDAGFDPYLTAKDVEAYTDQEFASFVNLITDYYIMDAVLCGAVTLLRGRANSIQEFTPEQQARVKDAVRCKEIMGAHTWGNVHFYRNRNLPGIASILDMSKTEYEAFKESVISAANTPRGRASR
jgi:hypothetical protein